MCTRLSSLARCKRGGRAACWWHDDPAALGVYEVTHKVVRGMVRGSAMAMLYPQPPTVARAAPRILHAVHRTHCEKH